VVLDRVPGLSAAVLDHAQLLDAILAGDGARARALMHDHVIAFEREIAAAFGAD
jgi:DNA-binding GntR family transcriptional regulator